MWSFFRIRFRRLELQSNAPEGSPLGAESLPRSRGRVRLAWAAESAGDARQHLRVRWELLHEEEQPFDGLERFIAGEPTADDVDLVQVRFRNEQFFTAG